MENTGSVEELTYKIQVEFVRLGIHYALWQESPSFSESDDAMETVTLIGWGLRRPMAYVPAWAMPSLFKEVWTNHTLDSSLFRDPVHLEKLLAREKRGFVTIVHQGALHGALLYADDLYERVRYVTLRST